MKAVVKTAPGEGNVELRDIAEPAPGPGQVLIAVQAAGICGTDIHIYHDEFRSWPPVVLGHEVSGRVVALGAGVTSVAEGDRVTTETYFSTCGVCRFCRDGRVNLCPQSPLDRLGRERRLHLASWWSPRGTSTALPENLGYRAGALVEPLACVVHGVLERRSCSRGDLAVVAGPGAIGLLTLQVARAAGARVIVLGTAADAHRLSWPAAGRGAGLHGGARRLPAP